MTITACGVPGRAESVSAEKRAAHCVPGKEVRKLPKLKKGDILVGWGCKTSRTIILPDGVTTINHPGKIKDNRNKLNTLVTLSEVDELSKTISPFYANADIDLDNLPKFPLVGRTKYHQGGKGFWLCLTADHIKNAMNEGAQYFQEYIPIKTEYRLHVAFGKVIYAVKKIENPSIEHWIEQRKEKIVAYKEKNNIELDDVTIDKVLSMISKDVVLPDRIVRSNKRGWRFSSLNLDNLNEELKNIAVKGIEAIDLNFGAIDCAIDEEDNPYIIEINSGPGLQGSPLKKYVEIFKEQINRIENPEEAKAENGIINMDIEVDLGEPIVEEAVDNADRNEGLVRIIRNIKNDEEARKVIELLMQ